MASLMGMKPKNVSIVAVTSSTSTGFIEGEKRWISAVLGAKRTAAENLSSVIAVITLVCFAVMFSVAANKKASKSACWPCKKAPITERESRWYRCC